MKASFPPILPSILIEEAVRAALREDLGRAGDITTAATIPPEATAEAVFVARQPLTVCGMAFAEMAFRLQNAGIAFEAATSDGQKVAKGERIATVTGNARGILSGERVALNYLTHLSAISSYTAEFVARIAHTKASICCTRKTVPGLRAFQKYAVKVGGGANHRFGLDDAILIKDNHIAVCGSIARAVEQARAYAGHLVAIEAEVDTLDQLAEALSARVEAILVDNFSIEELNEAVAMARGRARLEASGGIDFTTVKAVAETGVDYISTSKITMAAPAVDIGLDIAIG